MARFNISEGVLFLDRKEWGANDNFPRLGFYVPREDRTHLIIHHTVISDPDASPNVWENEGEIIKNMKKLQTIRPDLGLDVPYNFVIFLKIEKNKPSICVCEGRGEDRSGAHTKGHNTKGIGISIQGNFNNEIRHFNLFIPLISRFLGWLKYSPNGNGYGGPYKPLSNLGRLKPNGRNIFAHCDFNATNCPGKNILSEISKFKFSNPDDF